MDNVIKLQTVEAPTLSLEPLNSLIREQRAALEELEAGRREMESVLDHLLPFRQSSSAAHPAPANGKTPSRNGLQTGLSKRELQVLGLMVDGLTSKEIAAHLGITFKTAVTHRASIMSKLDVHETASVVREAIRRGLV